MTYLDKLVEISENPLTAAYDSCPEDIFENAGRIDGCFLELGENLDEVQCAKCWLREVEDGAECQKTK